jgi:hypothetical protein
LVGHEDFSTYTKKLKKEKEKGFVSLTNVFVPLKTEDYALK